MTEKEEITLLRRQVADLMDRVTRLEGRPQWPALPQQSPVIPRLVPGTPINPYPWSPSIPVTYQANGQLEDVQSWNDRFVTGS